MSHPLRARAGVAAAATAWTVLLTLSSLPLAADCRRAPLAAAQQPTPQDVAQPQAASFVGESGKYGDTSRQSWIEVVSWKPRIQIYHKFMSDEECDHLIKISMPRIARSAVVNPDGSIGDDPIRTSWGTFLVRGQDEVVHAIEKRLADWTHLPVVHGEDLQVLRYSNNQEYGAHWDDLDESESKEGLGGGSVRVATVLLYLSDTQEGGETAFPSGKWIDEEKQTAGQTFSKCARGGVAAQPRKGNAVLFWDTKPGSVKQDKWSLHTGCPVTKGTKWAAVKWIHARPFGGLYPPKPLATSGASLMAAEAMLQARLQKGDLPADECADENKMCAGWAEDGECDRNSGFMRDACRLSCRECCPQGDVLCERQRRHLVIKPLLVGRPDHKISHARNGFILRR